VILLAAACSGKPSAPAHPGGGPQTSIGPQTSDLGPQDHNQTSNGGKTQQGVRDCDKLIAHAVELGVAERPDDQKANADERQTMNTQLRTAWTSKCQQLTSHGYECALAAHTLAELDACGG